MPGESKVGYSGEDDEGRLLVEDLQRGDITEVQSGEDWNQQWRKQLGDDGDGEAVVEALKIIKAQISILIYNYYFHSYYNNINEHAYHTDTNTSSSDHKNSGTSTDCKQKLPSQETVQRSTRSDGSGHSVLETLGQTQRCGDDGDDVGWEEFNCRGVIFEYYVGQTKIIPTMIWTPFITTTCDK